MDTQQIRVGIVGRSKESVGLAVLLTSHGYPTVVTAAGDTFLTEFNDYYSQLVAQRLISEEEAERCATYLRDGKDISACSIIFECEESLEEKRGALLEIAPSCSEAKAILSITTTLLPSEISAQCPAIEDKLVVGHVAAAAHLMPLVELMPAKNEAALNYVKEVFAALDRKTIVLNKPVRGFVSARIYYALCREVLYLVENGYGAARDVDIATMYSILPRYTAIGPFEGADNASIDLTVTTTGHLFPLFVNEQEAPKFLREAVSAGRLGAAAGAGVYDYDDTAKKDLESRIYAPWLKFFTANVPETPCGE